LPLLRIVFKLSEELSRTTPSFGVLNMIKVRVVSLTMIPEIPIEVGLVEFEIVTTAPLKSAFVILPAMLSF